MPIIQVTAAFVNNSSHEVLDVRYVVQSNPPEAPDGFRWLVNYNSDYSKRSDWGEGEPPVKGNLWQGDIPATFITPPPVPSELDGLSSAQLRARLSELNTQSAEVIDALAVAETG